jgi:hypothetical protein
MRLTRRQDEASDQFRPVGEDGLMLPRREADGGVFCHTGV